MKEVKFNCTENHKGTLTFTDFQDGTTGPVIEVYTHDFKVGACACLDKEDLTKLGNMILQAASEMED